MEVKRERLVEIEGQKYVATIFNGDGALYDQLRGPSDPIRKGSMLLKAITEDVAQEDSVGYTSSND